MWQKQRSIIGQRVVQVCLESRMTCISNSCQDDFYNTVILYKKQFVLWYDMSFSFWEPLGKTVVGGEREEVGRNCVGEHRLKV